MAGRTLYWPKDSAWWRRGRIVKLGREFGPAGPAVIDHLMCDARTQGPIRGHDGSVRSDFASLSLLCFVNDDELVGKIVARAVELGVLDEFDDLGGGAFECRMSGWHQDVERPLNTERQRSKRNRKSPDVPGCTPESPDVTREVEGDREEERPPLNPPQGENQDSVDLRGSEFPPSSPSNRTRDRDNARALQDDWIRAHIDLVGDLDRTTLSWAVSACVGAGVPATAENVARAATRWEDAA